MDAGLEARLSEALAALERGETPAAVLARNGEDAAVLAPLLEVAAILPDFAPAPRPAAQAASRRAFLAAAAELAEAPGTPWWRRVTGTAGVGPRGLPRPAPALVGLTLAALVFLAWGAGALPGDPLYPAKRAVDGAWLAAQPAGSGRATAEAAFWRRRAEEVRALLAAGRAAPVTLQGPIEAMAPDRWRLAGIDADVGPTTRVLGTPELGEMARAWGRTEDGRLWVDTIVCEPPAGQDWLPSATTP